MFLRRRGSVLSDFKVVMLKYFVWVVRDLAAPGIVYALILALTVLFDTSRQKKAVLFGSLAGLLGAVLVAFLRHFYLVRDKKMLIFNLYLGGILLVSSLVYFAFNFGILHKKNPMINSIVLNLAGSLFSAGLFIYYLPADLLYPFHFLIKGQSVFSTDYLFKLIGFCFGLVLVFLLVLSVYKVLANLSVGYSRALSLFVYVMNFLIVFPYIINQMLIRRWIRWNRGMRNMNRFFSNHGNLFLFAVLAVLLVIAAALFYKSFHNVEPYSNPAEHRKIRAKCRNQRRWVFAFLLVGTLSVVNLTALQKISKKEVRLSAAESFTLSGDIVSVPVERVSDGNLHRFEYKTSDEVGIRFIIIQKNAFAFGIGFDACEICGATGYYQKGSQVICKLCDVVMNINTIGFKGGCNPIPLPYVIEDGEIRINVKDLEVEKRRFR